MNNRKVSAKVLAVLSGITLFLLSTAFASDILVIVNKNVPNSSLSTKQIKDIYSANMTKWDDNKSIVVTTNMESELHEIFLKKYINKSPSQFENTWKKIMFTGKGTIPPKIQTSQSLIDQVASTSGAIGYVAAGLDTSRVKVIEVK